MMQLNISMSSGSDSTVFSPEEKRDHSVKSTFSKSKAFLSKVVENALVFPINDSNYNSQNAKLKKKRAQKLKEMIFSSGIDDGFITGVEMTNNLVHCQMIQLKFLNENNNNGIKSDGTIDSLSKSQLKHGFLNENDDKELIKVTWQRKRFINIFDKNLPFDDFVQLLSENDRNCEEDVIRNLHRFCCAFFSSLKDINYEASLFNWQDISDQDIYSYCCTFMDVGCLLRARINAKKTSLLAKVKDCKYVNCNQVVKLDLSILRSLQNAVEEKRWKIVHLNELQLPFHEFSVSMSLNWHRYEGPHDAEDCNLFLTIIKDLKNPEVYSDEDDDTEVSDSVSDAESATQPKVIWQFELNNVHENQVTIVPHSTISQAVNIQFPMNDLTLIAKDVQQREVFFLIYLNFLSITKRGSERNTISEFYDNIYPQVHHLKSLHLPIIFKTTKLVEDKISTKDYKKSSVKGRRSSTKVGSISSKFNPLKLSISPDVETEGLKTDDVISSPLSEFDVREINNSEVEEYKEKCRYLYSLLEAKQGRINQLENEQNEAIALRKLVDEMKILHAAELRVLQSSKDTCLETMESLKRQIFTLKTTNTGLEKELTTLKKKSACLEQSLAEKEIKRAETSRKEEGKKSDEKESTRIDLASVEIQTLKSDLAESKKCVEFVQSIADQLREQKRDLLASNSTLQKQLDSIAAQHKTNIEAVKSHYRLETQDAFAKLNTTSALLAEKSDELMVLKDSVKKYLQRVEPLDNLYSISKPKLFNNLLNN